MSAGIARVVRAYYQPHKHVTNQLLVGDVFITPRSKFGVQAPVINLVTKTKFFLKPTKEDFIKTIKNLRNLCLEKGYKQISCAPLGCGRDKLDISFVKQVLKSEVMSYGITVVIFNPPIIPHIYRDVCNDGIPMYWKGLELVMPCPFCGEVCRCVQWNTVNVGHWNDVVDTVNFLYSRDVRGIKELSENLHKMEEELLDLPVIGFSGTSYMQKVSIVYYGSDIRPSAPMKFSNGRAAFVFLVNNIKLLCSNYYENSLNDLTALTTDSEDSEDENPTIKVVDRTKRCAINTVSSVRNKGFNKHRFDFVYKGNRKFIKKQHINFDKRAFLQELVSENRPPCMVPIPPSMKIEFASEVVQHPKNYNFIANTHPLCVSGVVKVREMNFKHVLHIKDERDQMLYDLYILLIRGNSWSEVAKKSYSQFLRKVGQFGNRRLWYELSQLSRTHGLPNVQAWAKLHQVTVPKFGRLRDSDCLTKKIKIRQALLDYHDKELTNFSLFVLGFRSFVDLINNDCGRTNKQFQWSTSKFLCLYMSECTNHFLKCTGLDDIRDAARNFGRLDVNAVNEAVRKATGFMNENKVTLEKVKGMLDNFDVDSINSMIQRVDSVMGTCDNFLKILTTPIFDKVFDFLKDLFKIPGPVMERVKKRFTPVNIAAMTWLFISYQHTDSTVMKIIYVLGIIERLGLLSSGKELLMKFCAGFSQWWQSDDEEEFRPTFNIMNIFDVITSVIKGGSSLMQSLIGGFACLLKGVTLTPKIMRVLLKYAGGLGRDINFSYLGMANSGKFMQQIIGAWKAVVAYLFGGKAEVSTAEKWRVDFDNWRILLHVIEDPRVRSLLRVSEKARVNVDHVYDEGVRLMKEASSQRDELRRELCELSRLMRRAKDIADAIDGYRKFAKKRVTPYTICLESAPGIGKTNMVHTITDKFHEFVYPDLDRDSLLYNLPLDSEFCDGLTGQKIVVVDDYNMLQDAARMIKLIPLTSNVPTVSNQANLNDKGECYAFDILIKTTNNRSAKPNGFACDLAFDRRDNVVVQPSVDARWMTGGKLDREKVLDSRVSQLRAQNVPIPEGIDADDYYNHLAITYYLEQEYYTITIRDPITSETLHVFRGMKSFLTWLLKDFAKHRTREEELLDANSEAAIDRDDLASCVALQQIVDKHREEIAAQTNLIQRYFEMTNRPAPEDYAEGILVSVLNKLSPMSPEQRELIMGEPRLFMHQAYNSAKEVLRLGNIVQVFENSFGGDLVRYIQNVQPNEELPIADDLPVIEIDDDDEEDEDVLFAREFQPTMFSYFRNRHDVDDEFIDAPAPPYELEENEGAGHYCLNFNLQSCLDLEFDVEEVPPNGWCEMDFFRSHIVNGREHPFIELDGQRNFPLPSRVATDFVLRLNASADNLGMSVMSVVNDGEFIPLINPVWSLRYPLTTAGFGSLSYEKETEWFKESLNTFALMSEEQRMTLVIRQRSIMEDYLFLNRIIQDVRNEYAQVRREQNSSWHRFWRVLGAVAAEVVIAVFCICLYVGLLLGLAWLISPTPTATKYQVDPRKAGVQQVQWRHTSNIDSVSSVATKYRDNFQVISRSDGNDCMVRCQLTYVQGTYALTSYHFFPLNFFEKPDPIEVYVTSPEYPDMDECGSHFLFPDDCYPIPDSDCVVFKLDNAGRISKSLLKHFILEDDLRQLNGMSVRISQRELTSESMVHFDTTVRNYSNINLNFKGDIKISSTGGVRNVIMTGCVNQGCSGGLTWCTDNQIPRSIIGVVSGTSKRWCVATPVTQEDLQAAFEALKAPSYEDAVFDHFITVDSRAVVLEKKIMETPANKIFDRTHVVGYQRDENSPSIMSKTSYVPTEIADLLPDTGREPVILSDRDPRRKQFEGKPHFLNKSLNKFCADLVQPAPQDVLDRVAEDISDYWLETGAFNNMKVLNINDAITAVGLDCSSFDLSTSPGIPWSLEKNKLRGKTTHIERIDDNSVRVSAKLETASKEFLQKLESNVVPFYLQNDFMKDELRDATLGKQNVARTVTVMPMHVTIVARQLMLDYYSRIHTLAKRAYPISVGINMESRSCQLMLNKLCSKSDGKYCIDFDVSNWDGHFPMWMAQLLAQIRNRVYNQTKYSKEHSVARDCLYRSMVHGYIQIGKFVYRKYRGMSSGFCGTAEDNSEAHFALVYLFWIIIMLDNNLEPSFNSFLRNVTVFVYGDDIILSVTEEVVEIFNGLTLAKYYKLLGWPVTPAQKGGQIIASKHWSELTFLKRSFVLLPQHSIVLAPLDISTIRSLFSWQRGTSEDQMYENFNDAFRFLMHHGKEVFEEHKDKIGKLLRLIDGRGLYVHYEDIFMLFKRRYDCI